MPHPGYEPTSLWWTRAGAAAPRPPLVEDASADVVVVGAGIVGATVAYDLANAGVDVVLVDSGRIASGATGNTSAKLTALQSPRYARLESEHGADAAATYARFSLDAVARVRELADDAAALEPATALTWVGDPASADDLRDEGRAARRAGLPVEDADPEEHGLPLAFGLTLRDQAQFEPVGYVRSLVDRAERAGARVHEDTPVEGVSLTGAPREVRLGTGATVRAERVVIATGLPILDRGGWFARTEPRRSYVVSLRTASPPPSMAIRADGATRSSRPTVGADGEPLVLIAGEDHRTGRGGDTRRRYDALTAWGRDALGAGEVVHRWSAQDWSSVDGLPLVGPLVPGDDRVLAAAGFDKWGLTSGTAAAGAIVRRVLGQPLDDPARLLDPARMTLRGAAAAGRANGIVAWSMAQGWLRVTRSGHEPAEGDGIVHHDGVRPTATSRVDGVTRSCSAVCPHLGGIVEWEPGDESWACPLHGSRFDADGRVLSGPTTRGLAGRS